MRAVDIDLAGLPTEYAVARPEASDVEEVAELLSGYEHRATGSSAVTVGSVRETLIGIRSWTRRQALVRDSASGRLLAWLSVHDRAAGRVLVDCIVTPDLRDGLDEALAGQLFAAAERYAADIAQLRDLRWTLLDSGAFADDRRQQRFLELAGYAQVRTWLQMSRPVTAAEATSLPGPREGVTVRRVERHHDGLPVAEDLQAVHQVLEESFADHFSSYRESFPEFVMRLREVPGHRWDHWWLAEIDTPEGTMAAGALVSSESPAGADGTWGSYVDYIGVHRRARGRGVAKALLHTVIADAAARGRGRVDLEVDADSPTGADGLYASLGWVTVQRTQSWHRDLELKEQV